MLHKLLLALRAIKNFHILLLDKFGLINGEVLYNTRDGSKFIARAGSSDKDEIIINAADSEYPSDFYPKVKKPVIFDVGANIGETSIFMYKKLKKQNPSIFAFEPFSDNFSYLVKNIRLNKIKNIFPQKLAISDNTGSTIMNLTGKNFDGGYIQGLRIKTFTSTQKIRTVTLEDFCKKKKINNIDLLKMDIEGSEYSVFKHSIKFIKKHVKTIFLELHNLNKKENPKKFKQSLIKNGFEIKQIIMNRTLFINNPHYEKIQK